MKDSTINTFDTANSNAMLSAELLMEKEKELSKAITICYTAILEEIFEKNNRKYFDNIQSSMGSLAFYKGKEPLGDFEKKKYIKGIDNAYEFLNEFNDRWKITGDCIIINKKEVSINGLSVSEFSR